jgi:hypothetical protein
MGKNIAKKNEEKLKVYLAKQKANDIKSDNKKTGNAGAKS